MNNEWNPTVRSACQMAVATLPLPLPRPPLPAAHLRDCQLPHTGTKVRVFPHSGPPGLSLGGWLTMTLCSYTWLLLQRGVNERQPVIADVSQSEMLRTKPTFATAHCFKTTVLHLLEPLQRDSFIYLHFSWLVVK